jgi:hypothetical protein
MTKNRKSSRRWTRTKQVLKWAILFLVVLGFAARPLARGVLFYQSYWGGAVFTPFVLLMGALIVVIAVREWIRK